MVAGEEHLLYTHYCEYSKSQEGDHGEDRVCQSRLLMTFQEDLEGTMVGEYDGAAF